MVWEEKIREGFLPMRAWKGDGYPEVGYWMWTGEVDLAWEVDVECKSDWVPHGLNGECLHTSRLGEHNTFQMTGQGYKELVHRQLYQDLAGMQLPPTKGGPFLSGLFSILGFPLSQPPSQVPNMKAHYLSNSIRNIPKYVQKWQTR